MTTEVDLQHRAGAKTPRPARPWTVRPGLVVALVTLAAAAVAAPWWLPLLLRPANLSMLWMLDLNVYRTAGRTLLDGRPLYEGGAQMGPFVMPFVYSPFGALLAVPLGALGAGPVTVLWTVTNVAGIGYAAWWALGATGLRAPRPRLALAAAVTVFAHLLDPVLINFLCGQVNTFIMVLVLLAFPIDGPRRFRGVALGIAAGIKLTPLLFIPYLWITGRRRTAVEAAAGSAGTIAVGFLALPADSRDFWFTGIFHDAARIMISPLALNASLPGFFGRLTGELGVPAWSLPVSAVLGVLGLLAARWVTLRRGDPVAGMLVVAATAFVISPVSWPAHGVWIVPALVWLLRSRWRSATWLPYVLAALLAAWFATPVHSLAERFVDGVPYLFTPEGNLLGTLGSTLPVVLVVLVLLPVWAPRLRPRVSREE